MGAKLGKYFLAAVAILAVWTTIIAGLALFSKPGASVAAFTLPGRALEVAVEAGGSLEELTGMMVITRSPEEGFVARLYASGALLVIDARVVSGCRAAFDAGRRTIGID